MSIHHYNMVKRAQAARMREEMKQSKRQPKKSKDVPEVTAPTSMLHDDNISPKDKKEWMRIVILVIVLCAMGLSYGIGHHFGRVAGRREAVLFMVADLQHADTPCIDQLAKNFQAQEDK